MGFQLQIVFEFIWNPYWSTHYVRALAISLLHYIAVSRSYYSMTYRFILNVVDNVDNLSRQEEDVQHCVPCLVYNSTCYLDMMKIAERI